MRSLALMVTALAACKAPEAQPPPHQRTAVSADAAAAQPVKLAADTRETSALGSTFIAPKGWSMMVRGPATILESPDGDRLALVELRVHDADAAVAGAWAAFDPMMKWPLKGKASRPDHGAWVDHTAYRYDVPSREHRLIAATAARHDDLWMAVLYDFALDNTAKYKEQLALILDSLVPKNLPRETFAGQIAHRLDTTRIAKLTAFIESSVGGSGAVGIALGLVQDGKVVFAGGFGVREFGKPEKVDADTLFRIASVTKPLSTLLLAKLVDDAVLTWDTPVTAVMPTFKLADPDATRHILVKHLFCACTGVPWRDYDVQFGFGHATPLTAIAKLATMAPLDAFGARFAYSNLLAAVGGFVAGHAFAPKLELGAAYDLAMAKRVFEPLAMRSTTFDTARALNSNHAGAYSLDIEGSTAPVDTAINGTLAAIRPAAGAWSNIADLLMYVQMELARGWLSDGRRYISEAALLARREPQIAVERGTDYGMALMTSRESGVTVIHHDGDAAGYHSKVLWLPDHQVGAVILATSDVGQLVRDQITRKLLEVLFDGMPLADARLARLMTEMRDGIATERRGLTIPAATDLAARLAPRYTSGNLGPLTVKREKGTTTFDFGDWRSEVVSWTGRDGTLAFVTIAPGLGSYVFTVGMRGDKRTLVLADHHDHTYTFIEDN